MINGHSGSVKAKSLFDLINHQPNIEKICLYTKDRNEAKNQFLIKDVGTKHFNDPKGFIEYSNDMHDIDKNIEEYNPNKKRLVLFFL